MSEAPKRITAWGDQTTLGVVYKAGPRPMQNMVPFRATEYTRADLSDALLREAMEALGGVMTACDQGRMVAKTGVGGMTIEANIRGSVYMGVPAWPIEEARATLAKLRAHFDGEKE